MDSNRSRKLRRWLRELQEQMKRSVTRNRLSKPEDLILPNATQPISGNQRPNLLTALMNMSLGLRLPRKRRLSRSSSNASRLLTSPTPKVYFRGERLGSKNAFTVVLDLIPQDPLEIHYLTGGCTLNVGSMGRDTPHHNILF